jgi:hypothetical protein
VAAGHLIVPLEIRSPYPYSADGKFPGGATVALHDPFVALAYVAACTERIKLGTGVFVPLRNAVSVAKAAASLDVCPTAASCSASSAGWPTNSRRPACRSPIAPPARARRSA